VKALLCFKWRPGIQCVCISPQSYYRSPRLLRGCYEPPSSLPPLQGPQSCVYLMGRHFRKVATAVAKIVGGSLMQRTMPPVGGQNGSTVVKALKTGCTPYGRSPMNSTLGAGGTGIEPAPCGCGARGALFRPVRSQNAELSYHFTWASSRTVPFRSITLLPFLLPLPLPRRGLAMTRVQRLLNLHLALSPT
jgi:hypothetical protein